MAIIELVQKKARIMFSSRLKMAGHKNGACYLTVISGATIHVPCQVFPAHFDGLVQDCSNSSALAMELLQSCAEPSIRRSVARTWFTEARTSNELPWLDLQKEHRNRNPRNEPPAGLTKSANDKCSNIGWLKSLYHDRHRPQTRE